MAEKIRGLSIGLDMSTIGIERSMTAIKNSFREVKHAARVNLNNIKFDTKSVDGYRRNLDQLSDAFKMQKRNVDELKRELDKLEETGKGNTDEAQRLRNEINKQTDEMNRLERAVESTTRELEELERAQQGASWTKAGEGVTNFSDNLGKAGQTMKDVGGKMTAAITVPLVGIGGTAIKSAIDFEDAFAGVKKTVDMSEAEFDQLETSIRDMAKELPFAATEIAGVAEAAGQLGIENENIEEFTKTILDIGVATDLTTEQAANDFARFANIVQMPQENFDRLGSSIVALGNNTAATEPNIMDMSMRLAGAGAQAGLSEADILALAAAMSSVGIEAEAGGSSMSTVMKKIQNAVSDGGADLELFAQASGMSASDFAAQWESSPIEALDSFIKGLAASGDSGENLNGILEGLGITGIRETDTILRMAGAQDLLSETVDISTNAWEENTALGEEAAVRYETMASKVEIMKNRLKDLGIEIGEILMPIFSDLLDKVSDGIEWFSGLRDETKENIVEWGLFAAAAGPVIMAIGGIMTGISAILTPIGGLLTTIGGAGGLVPALKLLGGKILSVTAAAAPWILGIGLVIGAGVGLVKHLSQEAIPAVNDFGDEVSDETTEAVTDFMDMADGATAELDRLFYSGEAITEEGAEALTTQFGSMFEIIQTNMEESFNEDKEILSEFFAESSALSDEHERAIMFNMELSYEERQAKTQEKQDRINEIIQESLDNEGEITQKARTQIDEIEAEMRELAIEELSENEQEQLIIKETMAQQKGDIDARTASDMIKRSKEAKEGVIDEANEQYEGVIAAVARQRDTTGGIKDEEAEVLIAEAERVRDESIAAAEDTHEGVVTAAEEQLGEHVAAVDLETGEILTKWDQTKNELGEIWAGFVDLWPSWDEITEKALELGIDLEGTWNTIKEVATIIWGGIEEVFFTVISAIEGFVMEVFGGLVEWWDENHELVFETVSVVWNNIKESIENILAIVVPIIMVAWEGIKVVTELVWNKIKSIIEVAIEIIKGVITTVMQMITGDWEGAWETIKSTVMNVWNIIRENVEERIGIVRDTIANVLDSIKEKWDEIWNTIKTNLSKWWNGIIRSFIKWLKDKLTQIRDFKRDMEKYFSDLWTGLTKKISGWLSGIYNSFKSWLDDKIDYVTGFGGRIGKAFSNVWTTVTNAMGKAWDNIKSKFDGFLEDLVKGAKNIGKGLRNAFASAFNTGIKAVTSGVNNIIKGINWVLKKLSVSKTIDPWTVKPIPMYAQGTDGHPGGLAMVNDGAGAHYQEAFATPDGQVGFFPKERDLIVPLPKGTSVLPGAKTKDLMDQLNIPKYAGGVGDGINKIWEWISGGAESLLDKAIGLFGAEPKSTDSTIWGDVAKGAFKTVKDAAVGFIDDQISGLFSFGGVNFGSGFTLTSRFGPRWGRMHEGVDYAAAMGTPIPSQSGGKVTQSRYHPSYGNFVEVTSGGVQYRYAHNSKNLVDVGEAVRAGQILGLVGSTGRSTGPHVHFEIRTGGRAVDPLTFSGAGGGGFSGSSGMNQWTAVASQALQMTGQYSPANLSRLLMQMKSESGGNARAINNWDSNARRGTPSKGLMQVIDPTFNAYKMPGYNNIWNPLDNILASIRYSLSRYGSLNRAWRGVGYATGGLINEEGLYRLAEDGHPEFVIPTDPARRTDAMKLLALAGKRIQGSSNKRPNELISPASSNQEVSGGDTFHIHITANGDLPASTIRKMADRIEEEIKKKQDRRRMAKGEGVSFA